MANDLIGVTDRGNPGLDGLNFLSGSRNPTQQEGRENELWLNIRSQVVFQKVASRWVPRFRMKGEKGDRGDRGFSLRSGDGPPDAAVGRDGDIYVQMVSTTDVNAPSLWGPKLNGSWSWREPVDLRGAQGDTGDTGEIGLGWFFGTGAPSNDIGRDGEVYFRTSNSDVYGKAAGVWGVVASLVGPQGETGIAGPTALLPVTPWVTGMAAVVGPPATYVSNAGSSYQCLISHTAGASFAVDLAAGKWGIVAEKGADGAGTGTVVPDNPGALAGLLAIFAANDGTSIGGGGGTAGGAINWAAAVDVASAATCDIGAAASNVVNVTGTTGITSFGTIAAGAMRWVKFADALTITHNGTSLILPGAANITTAAGDTAVFVSEGSGNWRCIAYQKASGAAIVQVAGGDTAQNVGYLNIPQNSKSAAYTTVLGDAGKHIFHPSADTTARTWTIDSNANVAYPVGTAITFINQNGAGVITIAIASDTMRLAGAGTTGSRTLAANGVATAIKVASTEWIISGTGLT